VEQEEKERPSSLAVRFDTGANPARTEPIRQEELTARPVMQGQVLLVNLAKGHIEDSSSLIISFRVGVEDASYLVREFQPKFEELDLLQVPNYRILSEAHD
jgi:hypothetical protein